MDNLDLDNLTLDTDYNSDIEPSKMQTNFTLIKDSKTYNLIVKNKSKTIDINVRRVMVSTSYEGIFTFEDFWSTSKAFYFYEKLEDIHKVLVQKIHENNVEFGEVEDKFHLKFTFCFETEKKQAVLQLNKANEGNFSKLVEDLCKTVISNSETLKEIQSKQKDDNLRDENQKQVNKNYEEVLSKHNEKFEKLQELISIQSKKIENLEKKKEEEEKLIKSQENLISSYENELDGLKYSKIVKNKDIELVKKWIDSTNYNKVHFKLLYRATEHGKKAKDFHPRCDEKVNKIINKYIIL